MTDFHVQPPLQSPLARPASRQAGGQDRAMLKAQHWERVFQVASLVTTLAIVPAAGWAWRTTEAQVLLQQDISTLRMQLAGSQQQDTAQLEELRALRTAIEAMRLDVLQRLTKVETRIEHSSPKETR